MTPFILAPTTVSILPLASQKRKITQRRGRSPEPNQAGRIGVDLGTVGLYPKFGYGGQSEVSRCKAM